MSLDYFIAKRKFLNEFGKVFITKRRFLNEFEKRFYSETIIFE